MKKTVIAVALAVAVAVPAAAQKRVITMTGLVTSEGVECPSVRGPDGQLYSLAGQDLDLVPGDVVQIQGSLAEASSCNQGRTIAVSSVEQIHPAADQSGLDVDGALAMLRRGAAYVGEKAQELGQTIDRNLPETWR